MTDLADAWEAGDDPERPQQWQRAGDPQHRIESTITRGGLYDQEQSIKTRRVVDLRKVVE